MEKFSKSFRIDSTRLKGYDYGREGAYFVTICVKNMECLFGKVIRFDNSYSVKLTELGQVAYNNWIQICSFHPYTFLDEFIVMPNHIHGIIAIIEQQHLNNDETPDSIYKNKFGPQSKNLSSIVRGYKASVRSYAKNNNIPFFWQPRYYDRIIRNSAELENIQRYIFENPVRWFNKYKSIL